MNLLSSFLFFRSFTLSHTPLSERLDQAIVSFDVVVLFHVTGDFPGTRVNICSAC